MAGTGDELTRRQNAPARSHAKEQLQHKSNGKPLKDLCQEVHDLVGFFERSLWPLCRA